MQALLNWEKVKDSYLQIGETMQIYSLVHYFYKTQHVPNFYGSGK